VDGFFFKIKNKMTAITALAKPTFVVGLNNVKTLNYKDNTNWAVISNNEYIYLQALSAILKISGPNGAFFINAGYPTNSFSNPDINLLVSTTKIGIAPIPVDIENKILNGQYSMYVKYQANFGDIVAVNTGTKKFTLTPSGDYADFIQNLKDTTGTIFKVVGGANAGTYTIASVTNGISGTEVIVNETIPSAVVAGVFYAQTAEQANSINFCYTIPTPIVEITSNCFQSRLICKDATDYGSAGVVIVSRENRVKYPLTMETPVADVVSTSINVNQQLTINPIYTHTWAGVITTNFTVDKTTYGLDIYIKGLQEHTVNCDIRLCAAFTCIKSLVDQYNAYLGTNPTAANKLQNTLFKVQDAYMLYSIAVECGNDEEACRQVDIIVDLIGSTGCDCGCTGSDDSGFAQLVLAVGSAEGGSMPLNYLEEDNITVNSNAKVPSNKAVINYVAQELEGYIPVYVDNVASGSGVINELSGKISLNATNAPVLPSEIGLFTFSNNKIEANDYVDIQIKDQSGIGSSYYSLLDVKAKSGGVDFRCILNGVSPVDNAIEIQFIVCKGS